MTGKDFEKERRERSALLMQPIDGSQSDSARREAEWEAHAAMQKAAIDELKGQLLDSKSYAESVLSYSDKMAAEAAEAKRAKSRFLRNVSYELRTPINSIVGMTKLLIETNLTSEQQEFTEIIRESASELMYIISDIMDLSKIESSRLDLATESFNLADILDGVLESVSFHAREKSLYVDLNCDRSVPLHLVGDGGRLRQVLLNLLNNAVKFTERGRVDVYVSKVEETDDTATVKFEVKDTGIGLPDGSEQLIFESFAAGDPTATRRLSNSGLSLSISKEIIKAMHGEILGRNREEGGAEFSFTVPLMKQLSAPDFWANFSALEGKNALLFGQAELSAFALEHMLSSVGMHVAKAEDSKELAEIADRTERHKETFDIVLLSTDSSVAVNLPFADGITECSAFKAAHFIGIHPPGHRSSVVPSTRRLFTFCVDRPIRPFTLLRDIKNALSGDIPTTRQTRPSRPAALMEPVRVLLVEDHLYSRKLTTQILNRLGLDVAVAGNGLEAVEALRRELYDLVLMDIEMPVMDGLSAARTIRNPDSRIMDPDVPIIALTAHAYEEDRQMCLKAGMNDYLLKPIDPDALKSVIDKFVACDESAAQV